MRADVLLEAGDDTGATTWRRVLNAIDELQRKERGEGKVLNKIHSILKCPDDKRYYGKYKKEAKKCLGNAGWRGVTALCFHVLLTKSRKNRATIRASGKFVPMIKSIVRSFAINREVFLANSTSLLIFVACSRPWIAAFGAASSASGKWRRTIGTFDHTPFRLSWMRFLVCSRYHVSHWLQHSSTQGNQIDHAVLAVECNG